jgi:hypothetical protein
MVIEVTPDFEPAFKAEVIQVISRLQTSLYQVGIPCIVKYDPDNKKTVAIEKIGDDNSNDNFTYSMPNMDISDYFKNKNPE